MRRLQFFYKQFTKEPLWFRMVVEYYFSCVDRTQQLRLFAWRIFGKHIEARCCDLLYHFRMKVRNLGFPAVAVGI